VEEAIKGGEAKEVEKAGELDEASRERPEK
jgi:hypothetical protein